MYPTIRQLQERNIREMIPDNVYADLREAYSKDKPTPKQQVLIDHIIRFLANKTAELYTSQKTTEQRVASKAIEYSPAIRPIYQDRTQTVISLLVRQPTMPGKYTLIWSKMQKN